MTDGGDEEYQRSEDLLSSDDDSLSLLHNLSACQSGGEAAGVNTTLLSEQDGSKDVKKKMEMQMNQVSPPEPEVSSCIPSTAGCVESSSRSGDYTLKTPKALPSVPQCVKIPKVLHKRSGTGETHLHKACKKNNLAQVKALIQAGISVNMEDYAGWTALHEACAVGDGAVVEELLKAGANVNARNCDGVTPLHDAAACGHHQVVKLLLQYGSHVSNRNVGGLSALDMAKEENIKVLLSQASSVVHEKSCNAAAHCRQSAATSSEPPCRCSFSLSRSDTANLRSRAGAREPSDIQLRIPDAPDHNLSYSKAVTAVFEDVRRKQTEMSTWPLTSLKDAGRYHEALTQIQSVLTEVLTKQRLQKDHLAQRFRRVPDSFRQSVLKCQLMSLASCQTGLIEVLQKQEHLEEAYVTTKARLSARSSTRQGSTVVRQLPGRRSAPAFTPESSTRQDSQQKESRTPLTLDGLLRSDPRHNTKTLTAPGCAYLPSQGVKAPAHTDVQSEKGGSCQSTSQPGKVPLQHVIFRSKRKNALIQTRAEDGSRYLLKLLQGGVIPPGSALQLLLKGHRHLAHVLADGSIVSKGKSHLTPERWLESILGNNIPVSSAYAWDKVTFRDRPLSHYLSNVEADGNAPQSRLEDGVQHRGAGCSQQVLTAEAASVNPIMNIKIIRLVDDEEFLPNAIMDFYWDELVKKDYLEPDDWARDLL